jgi:undecaprenol kinase
MLGFDLPKLRRSFGYAFRGLYELLKREQNARIHAIATVLVGIASIVFRLSRLEAAMLFFAVILVFAIEIINTAIEKLLDIVHPESHAQIAFIKDALAGAVLIAAIIALVVAGLVFYPHIRDFLTAS